MTLEEIQKNSEHWYNKYKELERENRLLGERCNQLLKDKGELTDKVKELEEELEVNSTENFVWDNMNKQLEQAKEIIADLVDLGKIWLEENDDDYEFIQQAEQFLKE